MGRTIVLDGGSIDENSEGEEKDGGLGKHLRRDVGG